MTDTGAAVGLLDVVLPRLDRVTVHDLGQELSKNAPYHPNYPPFIMTLQYRHGDWWTPCGMTFASELFITTGHTGTHVDGLGHTSDHGQLKDGVDAYEIQRGGAGLSTLGVEHLPPTVGRGILLDVAAHNDIACLPERYVITAAELEAVADSEGVGIAPGDTVLIRTGRGQFWDDPPRFFSVDVACPGTSLDAADWLLQRGVTLTGADNIAYEYLPPELGEFGKGHLALLGAGVPIIECLNLESLAATRCFEFLFVMAPLKIVGGTGSPVRPLALAG